MNPAVTLIGLTGQAGAGKDTAAHYLCEAYGFVRAAFADPLNDMLAELLQQVDIDHAALHERALKEQPIPCLPAQPSARMLKQTLGDWGRAIHPDWWVHHLAMRLGLHDLPRSSPVHDRIVLSDVRYANEAALIAAHGGQLIRLHRDQAVPVRSHSSEQGVMDLPASADLFNHGLTTAGLHHQLDAVMAIRGIERRDPIWR